MFTVQREGFSSIRSAALSIIDDLIAHGFSVKYPLTTGNYVAPTSDTFRVILETSAAESNIFHAAQPWRICIEIIDNSYTPQGTPALDGPYILAVYLGTSANLMDSGSVARSMKTYQSSIVNNEPFGNVGAEWSNLGTQSNQDATPRYTTYNEGFVCRYLIENGGQGGTRPLSYRLSITDRGIFLGMWDSRSSETGTGFNWLLVQRSVNKDSGAIRGTTTQTTLSRCPVFCVNSVNDKIYKFIVREKDVTSPSTRILNTADSEDSPAPVNPENQVSFNEDGDYIVSLINNLTTPRFVYPDELDMVGTISSDVIGESQIIEIQIYGEAAPRKYIGLPSNKVNNTGMRLVVLIENPNE
jgi:hypothetical protein